MATNWFCSNCGVSLKKTEVSTTGEPECLRCGNDVIEWMPELNEERNTLVNALRFELLLELPTIPIKQLHVGVYGALPGKGAMYKVLNRNPSDDQSALVVIENDGSYEVDHVIDCIPSEQKDLANINTLADKKPGLFSSWMEVKVTCDFNMVPT